MTPSAPSRGRRFWLLACALSFALLCVGHVLVPQRTLTHPDRKLRIGGDNLAYIQMAEGDFDAVKPPFKYRVLVPLLAGQAPLPAHVSLALISYLSLFACYLTALRTADAFDLELLPVILALLGVFASPWHLYHYYNPFLPDSFGLLALFLLFLSAKEVRFRVFAVTAVLGALARESVLLLAPLWLSTRQWMRALSIALLALLACLAVRLILGSPSEFLGQMSTAFTSVNRLGNVRQLVIHAFQTWHALWFLSVMGLFLMPWKHFVFSALAFCLLFAGALASSFFATDVGRMFAVMSPVMLISLARLCSTALREDRLTATLISSLFAAQLFVCVPPQGLFFVSSGSRKVFFLAGLICSLVTAVRLWPVLKTRGAAKLQALRSHGKGGP